MRYIECPKSAPLGGSDVTIFLAGGISGCPDWQAEVRDLMSLTDFALLNPRRANFPIDDHGASFEQIKWEWEHLRRADRIMFWFPKDNQAGCPIALFELGRWLASDKPLAIGVEPGYVRERDVKVQACLERPGIHIASDLLELVNLIL